MAFYYVLIIILALGQGIAGRVNLPIFALLLACAREPDADKLYLLAFVGGMLTDLLTGTTLGIWAGIYLLIVMLSGLIRTRFTLRWPWLVLLLMVVQLVSFYVWPFIK